MRAAQPCLGREAEFSELCRFLARLQRSSHGCRALLLRGEPGMATNALVQSFVHQAEQQSTPAYHATAFSPQPWRSFEILHSLLGSMRGHQAAAQCAANLSQLLTLQDPSTNWRAADLPLQPAAAHDARTGFFEAVRREIWQLATLRPCVFVFQDLQHADPDTLDLIDYLLRELQRRGQARPAATEAFAGLFLLAAEVSPAADDADPNASLRQLTEREHLEVVNVGRLTPEALAGYLQHEPVRDKIQALTGGRPADLDRLLAALPESLDDLLELHWRGLTNRERALLALLNVYPSPVTTQDFQPIFAVEPLELGRAVRKLERIHAIARGPEGFTQGILFEPSWLLQRLTAAEQIVAHQQAVQLLTPEAQRSGDPSVSEALVFHLLAVNAPREALPWAQQSARLLLEQFCPQRALRLLTAVLAALEPEPAPCEALSLLCDVQEQLGLTEQAIETRHRLLDYDRSNEVVHRANIAVLENRREPSPDNLERLHAVEQAAVQQGLAQLAAALMLERAESCLRGGQEEQAQVLARRLLDDTAEPTSRIRLGALQILGKRAIRCGDWSRAEQLFAQIDAEARAAGIEIESARAGLNLGIVALRRGHYEQARQRFEACLLVCERCHEFFGAAMALLNLGVVYEHLQRYAMASQFLQRAADIFERMGRIGQLSQALGNIGVLHLIAGDTRAAQQMLQRALQLDEGLTAGHQRAFIHLKLGEVALEERRLHESETLLSQAWEAFVGEGNQVDQATALLAMAHVEEARAAWPQCQHRLEQLADLTDEQAREQKALGRLVEARCAEQRNDWVAVTEAVEASLPVLESQRQHLGVAEALRLRARVATEYGEPQAESLLAEARSWVNMVAERFGQPARDRFLSRSAVQRILKDLMAPSPPAAPAERKERPTKAAEVLQKGWRLRFEDIIGDSREMLQVLNRVDRVAACDAPVLLLGESGTGKELVAQAICRLSNRGKRPFIRVNAAALTESLLESELFGHEKGSFTGALHRKAGKFEQAHGGTLFLDEIGDISPKMQVSLLRVLQEKEFHRVGGTEPVRVDVRVIFATHRNLEQLVKDGRFREDLYYRIHGLTIEIPPLRQRPADIAPLVEHCLQRLAVEGGHSVTLEPAALALLESAPWPGNVRELENALRSAYFLAEGNRIREADLRREPSLKDVVVIASPAYSAETGKVEQSALKDGFSLPKAKREMEIHYITQALANAQGNITKAADLLDMKRSRLSQKIKEYGIVIPERRGEP